MKDYYKILGLNNSASAEDIKSAYKQLALKYHPDRNRGSAHAEEQFKHINEAYQILSDSYKKEKYDLVYQYGSRPSSYQSYQTYSKPKEPVYYHGHRKKPPRYYRRSAYKVDKDYYREQLYTIVALLVAFVLVTSGFAINDYYEEERAKEEAIVVNNKLKRASIHFQNHEYDSTFSIIQGLIKQYPTEIDYSIYRDEYVKKIHQQGIHFYLQKEYIKAIYELNIAKTYIRRQDLNIWFKIGECHAALGSYPKAIAAFDYVFIRESTDIALALRIGDLYLQVGDKQNALSYYTSAKAIFKERQASIYGEAFELVIKPHLLDTSYFHLFRKRAQLNYELSNYEEATTDYNWAIFLRPQYATGYSKRAECWLKIGNKYRACLDWNEANQRGDRSVLNKIKQYCGS